MRESFEFPETLSEVILVVQTLSPTKWLLIDRETGQTYQGNAIVTGKQIGRAHV